MPTRTDAAALRLWNAWRRGLRQENVLAAAMRHGWRKWSTLEAYWEGMGLNPALPQSVSAMLAESIRMRRALVEELGWPYAYFSYAALKTANVEAMRAALSPYARPEPLGTQGELFENGENDVT